MNIENHFKNIKHIHLDNASSTRNTSGEFSIKESFNSLESLIKYINNNELIGFYKFCDNWAFSGNYTGSVVGTLLGITYMKNGTKYHFYYQIGYEDDKVPQIPTPKIRILLSMRFRELLEINQRIIIIDKLLDI